MTKGELLRFLEPFDDDIEILISKEIPTHSATAISPIIRSLYIVNSSGFGEIWLEQPYTYRELRR